MKKILIISTVSRQFYLFEQNNIEVLKSLNYEVHCAANFKDQNERLNSLNIVRHHFDIERSPFSIKNFKAYIQLKKIITSEKFDAIHCHSPVGGVIGRLAGKSLGINNILYTAHGFHFYKGAPIINWLIYYPIEKYMSKFTSHLITINEEDFHKSQRLKADNVYYVPGIGIDTNQFEDSIQSRLSKRKELGIEDEKLVLLSIGEMIERKNHETALKALSKINDFDFVYLICGKGELEQYLKDLSIKLGIEKKVKFLGFRNDIKEICIASDIFIFPSYQEGLPVSTMEAMSAGLPVIASKIRGNTDLIKHGEGGYLLDPKDIDGFSNSITKLLKNKELRVSMSINNKKEVKKFDNRTVKEQMMKIYSSLSKGEIIQNK